MSSQVTHLDLDWILRPLGAAEFLSTYFGIKYLYVSGRPGRFSDLISWEAVNGLLRHQYLRSFLRLVKDGKRVVDIESLFKGTYVDATDLTAHLRQGATLILNRVDEMHEPATILCSTLERTLEMPVRATMYAGWRSTKGFDIHSDDHDVFILQIAGRKHWKLYGNPDQSGRTPLDRRETPLGSQWEGILNDGDLLYIPRGIPHVAVPCNEPTLHLTIGLHSMTGLDLVRWAVEQIKNDQLLARAIPRFQSLDNRKAYVEDLKAALISACNAPHLMERYFQDLNLYARPRPVFALPWSATPDILPPSDASTIVLCLPRKLQLRNGGEGELMLDFDRKTLSFEGATIKLFEYLENHDSVTLKDFYEAHERDFDRKELVEFIADLAKEGVIIVSATTT